MEVRRCVNCMEELGAPGGPICPHCGYDQQKEQENLYGLKRNTILKGRYLVGNMLGQGGFGITYIGFDLVLNIKVAVKEYFPMGSVIRDNSQSNRLVWGTTQNSQEQWRSGCDSFLKEARRMAKIDTIPEIVRVRDTFMENQTAYIVMDFVEGRTLKDRLIKEGIMAFPDCLNLLHPLMESLDKVHRIGLIHRDISPDNIMLTEDGGIRLLDLGAAKDMSVAPHASTQLVTKRGFSPIEQYMETGKVGTWTDVYALCATIYYCITGKLVPEALDRMMKDTLDLNVPVKEPLTEEQKAVLRAGLAVKPEERIQTVGELLERLEGGGAREKQPESPGEPQQKQPEGTGEPRQKQPEDSGKLQQKQPEDSGEPQQKQPDGIAQGFAESPEQPEAGKKRQLPAGKKRIVRWLAAAIAAVCVVVGIVLIWGGGQKLQVVRLGNSATNIYNGGGHALIEEEYEYFLDAYLNLYVCEYDMQDETFYVDESKLLQEDATYINVGKESVYFCKPYEGTDGIWKMDLDGSNAEPLLSGNYITCLFYAELSDDSEALYFLDVSDDRERQYLYRYDIESGEKEEVLGDSVGWFNLYGEYIYYTDARRNWISLCRCDLQGEDSEVLDDSDPYMGGFIADEKIYLYSFETNAITVCNLEGEKIEVLDNLGMAEDSYLFAYGNGYLYYENGADGSLHRMQLNTSQDEVVLENRHITMACFNADNLWLMEAGRGDESGSFLGAYLCYKDGTGLLPVIGAEVTDDGLVYEIGAEGVTITGYAGKSNHILIPYSIHGAPVTGWDEDIFPEDALLYAYALEEEFQYEETEDGAVITGYSGEVLGELSRIAIPDTLGGMPVVAIGGSAFEESELHGIMLPDTVVAIEERAFYNAQNLDYIELSENLTYIGERAFAFTTGLRDIEFPETLREIDYRAFYYCGLDGVFIPEGVETIGKSAFADSLNLIAVQLPQSCAYEEDSFEGIPGWGISFY